MTDTKQPEALRLASEAWNFDGGGYRGVRSANAAMMGTLQDCATMIRKQYAENATLRAGYDAARLEIESLRADLRPDPGAYPVPQTTGKYSELQFITSDDRSLLHYNSNTDDVIEWVQNYARRCINADRAMRAAQPAPAAVAGPSEWCAGVEAVAKMLSKKADDFALEHGHDDMGGLSFGSGAHAEAKMDWHSGLLELEEEARAMLCRVFPMTGDEEESDLGDWQDGAAKPTQDGTYLREFDEGPGTSEFYQGKWLRDGFFPSDIQDARWRGRAATQPSPAAQGDALDAARYRLARRKAAIVCGKFIVLDLPPTGPAQYPDEEFDAAIDAARAAQEGKQ